jgi:hypothetical protein
VIGEVEEWSRGGPLLAHKDQRRIRAEQQQQRDGTVGIKGTLVSGEGLVEAQALRMIADLVVVLNKMDEPLST